MIAIQKIFHTFNILNMTDLINFYHGCGLWITLALLFCKAKNLTFRASILNPFDLKIA
jgi:hypothetical protein